MPYMLLRERYDDYGKWRGSFDELAYSRKVASCTGAQVFRNLGDPEELVVLLEFDDIEKMIGSYCNPVDCGCRSIDDVPVPCSDLPYSCLVWMTGCPCD